MKIRSISALFILVVVGLVISSCKKTISGPTEAQEIALLAKYIAKFHPTVTPKPYGLYVIETKAAPVGSDSLKVGDVVNVFCTANLIQEDASGNVSDGIQFYTTGDVTPITFTVGAGSVIPGWEEGLTFVTNGSEAKFIIPSWLAYYNVGYGGIPAYSTLIYYVKVSKVVAISIAK